MNQGYRLYSIDKRKVLCIERLGHYSFVFWPSTTALAALANFLNQSKNELTISRELKVIKMKAEALNTEATMAEVYFRVYQQGKIDRYHRQQLRATLLKESVSEQEQTAINRMLYAVRRGWLKVES